MTWGCVWGNRWGVSACLTADSQGWESKALPDTVFLGKSDSGTYANLVVDRSQEDSDMTAHANAMYEANAARFEQSDGRTIDLVIQHNDTHEGVLWAYGADQKLYLDEQTLIATWNGDTVELELPDITSDTQEFVISWSTEANPDTTGAGDAYRSELRAWNVDEDSYAQHVWTHDALDTDGGTSHAYWLNDTTLNDDEKYPGVATILRMSSQFHSATETYRTFVEHGSIPTTAGETRLEPPIPTRDSGIGDDGQFAGPVYALAAAHARRQDLRLWSPIVNEVYDPDHAPEFSAAAESGRGLIEDPFSSGWYLRFPFIRRRPVPPNCNRVTSRLCLFVASDALLEATLEVRLYSMNRPGFGNQPDTSPGQLVRHFATASVVVDAGESGVVVRLDFERCAVARDVAGYTYMALAFNSSGEDLEFKVLSWSVDPVLFVDESVAEVELG